MQFACAQVKDYNVYKSLNIEVKISSDVNVQETSSNAFLDSLQANLKLFPREDFQQDILSQDIESHPEGQLTVTDDAINIKWSNVKENKIHFEIDTVVDVKNDFPKIYRKISFPIEDLSGGLGSYIEETQHIDINADIRQKTYEIVAGETDLFIAAYRVADWVKTTIKYDLNTLTAEADQKASWVFTNKKGVCDEITNLFIAMLRSVKIPARFVSGMVYSNIDGTFGNHGWAEVYFPGYGWVPFDVTFGQYGWVDPSHVKMDDSPDSGVPSIEYSWRSRNIELLAEQLEFNTVVLKEIGQITPYTKLEIKPLKDKVKFGSYVPIQVSIENLMDYYLPSAISIVKAPDLFDKKNTKHFVLKPEEKKTFYWLVQIPAGLEEEYIYTSDLEVKTNFGNTASNVIKYAKTFDFYPKSWAEEQMEKFQEREQKFLFSNLNLKCVADKKKYYSTEDANIKCQVENLGNVGLTDVSVCLAETCEKLDLGIAESVDVSFKKPLVRSETVAVVAENQKMVRYSYVDLDVVEIPDLQIVSVEPKTVGYDEEKNLLVTLVTESPAYAVRVNIKNLGVAEWDTIEDKRFLKIPFKGKIFREGNIYFDMSYKDSLNKTYTKKQQFPITVTDIPPHIKLFLLFVSFFQ